MFRGCSRSSRSTRPTAGRTPRQRDVPPFALLRGHPDDPQGARGIGALCAQSSGSSRTTAERCGSTPRSTRSSPTARSHRRAPGRRRGDRCADRGREPRPHADVRQADGSRGRPDRSRAGRGDRPPRPVRADPLRGRRPPGVRRPVRGHQRRRAAGEHGGLQLTRADAARLRGVCPGRGAPSPSFGFQIPSVLDPALACEGKHAASVFAFYLPITGTREEQNRLGDVMADRVVARIVQMAPNFPEIIERRVVYPSYTYELMFGATGGDFCHGLLQPEHMGPFRPGPRAGRTCRSRSTACSSPVPAATAGPASRSSPATTPASPHSTRFTPTPRHAAPPAGR